MRKITFCCLLSALCSAAHAQGYLPPKSSSTTTPSDISHPLIIGETVPESLTVIDENGKKRILLSYKSPTEVLVIVFFSARCGSGETQWPEFRRMNARYKEWKVSFLAVNASTPDMLPELSNTLKREKLPWPIVQDENRAAASLLKISGTPELVVTDEYAVLEYRGPASRVKQALDTVIGHLETVQDPEPPFEGACPLP